MGLFFVGINQPGPGIAAPESFAHFNPAAGTLQLQTPQDGGGFLGGNGHLIDPKISLFNAVKSGHDATSVNRGQANVPTTKIAAICLDIITNFLKNITADSGRSAR